MQQLNKDRLAAFAILAIFAAVMAFILWAGMNAPPTSGVEDYIPMFP